MTADHEPEPAYEWDGEIGEAVPSCWTCGRPIHLADDDKHWEHSA